MVDLGFFCLKLKISEITGLNGLYFSGKRFPYRLGAKQLLGYKGTKQHTHTHIGTQGQIIKQLAWSMDCRIFADMKKIEERFCAIISIIGTHTHTHTHYTQSTEHCNIIICTTMSHLMQKYLSFKYYPPPPLFLFHP